MPICYLGERGVGKTTQKPLHYKGCLFHRIVKDFMIQGGDFSEGTVHCSVSSVKDHICKRPLLHKCFSFRKWQRW